MKRYILHPGYIISETDGDKHYIGVSQLLRLYKIPKNAEVIVDDGRNLGFIEKKTDVHCFPRSDGRYK